MLVVLVIVTFVLTTRDLIMFALRFSCCFVSLKGFSPLNSSVFSSVYYVHDFYAYGFFSLTHVKS